MGLKFILPPGQKYGRLTVLRDVEGRKGHPRVECQCDCGTVKVVDRYHLWEGLIQSCGCFNRERATKHGMVLSGEYHSWASMKRRCLKPDDPGYKYYGARGITIHPEWMDNFQAFFDHIGPRPEGTSLDRINNNDGYRPGNVRWATRKEQANNTRRNVFVEIGGVEMTHSEAARETGLNRSCLSKRIRKGYPLERLLAPSDRVRQRLHPESYCIPATDPVIYLDRMPDPTESTNGNESSSRTHKRVTRSITWDSNTGYLNIDWADGEKTGFNLSELPQSIINDLAYFGLLGRLQQSYVNSKGSPAVARDKASRLFQSLVKGDWGLSRGERASHSIVVLSLAALLKISPDEAQARWSALSPEKKKEVGGRSDVLAKIGELKAAASKPQASLASILK